MQLQTLRSNLLRTIAGKDAMRESLLRSDNLASLATRQFLEVNLVELRAILDDVEACIAAQAAPAQQFVPA